MASQEIINGYQSARTSRVVIRAFALAWGGRRVMIYILIHTLKSACLANGHTYTFYVEGIEGTLENTTWSKVRSRTEGD
jgi:hypothetical protein